MGRGHSGHSAILPLEPGAGGVKQAAPALNANLPTLGYLHALFKLPEDVSWSTQALTFPSLKVRKAGWDSSLVKCPLCECMFFVTCFFSL